EVPFEFLGGQGGCTVEVRLVADAADVQDRARTIRLGQLQGGFRSGGIELGPVEFLALEDATTELVERGLNVRLVGYGVVVWFCPHSDPLEMPPPRPSPPDRPTERDHRFYRESPQQA